MIVSRSKGSPFSFLTLYNTNLSVTILISTWNSHWQSIRTPFVDAFVRDHLVLGEYVSVVVKEVLGFLQQWWIINKYLIINVACANLHCNHFHCFQRCTLSTFLSITSMKHDARLRFWRLMFLKMMIMLTTTVITMIILENCLILIYWWVKWLAQCAFMHDNHNVHNRSTNANH